MPDGCIHSPSFALRGILIPMTKGGQQQHQMDPWTHAAGAVMFSAMLGHQLFRRMRKRPRTTADGEIDAPSARDLQVSYDVPVSVEQARSPAAHTVRADAVAQPSVCVTGRRMGTTTIADQQQVSFLRDVSCYGLGSPLPRLESAAGFGAVYCTTPGSSGGEAEMWALGPRVGVLNHIPPAAATAVAASRTALRHRRHRDPAALADALNWLDEMDAAREAREVVNHSRATAAANGSADFAHQVGWTMTIPAPISHSGVPTCNLPPPIIPLYPPTNAVTGSEVPAVTLCQETDGVGGAVDGCRKETKRKRLESTLTHKPPCDATNPDVEETWEPAEEELKALAAVLSIPPPIPAATPRRVSYLRHRNHVTTAASSEGQPPTRNSLRSASRLRSVSSAVLSETQMPAALTRRLSMVMNDT